MIFTEMMTGEGTADMKKRARNTAALLCVLLVIVLTAAGSRLETSRIPALDEGELISLRDQWTPAASPENGFRDYTYVIPELGGSAHTVSLEVFWCNAVLLLDGEELLSYEEPPRMAGTVRLWADLPEDCGGAVLTLRLEEGSRSGQRVLSGNSYLGSSNAVFARFVYDNLYALIFGCFTTLLGCIVLAGGYVLGYRREPKRVYGSLFLALFLFLSGMWVVCDSQFPMLFSGNTVRVVFLSFVTFMAMPVSLLLYVRQVLRRQRRILDALCLAQVQNLLVMLACYLLRRKEPYSTLIVCHALLVCSMGAVLCLCVRERRRGNLETQGIISGFVLFGICGIAAMALFYLMPGRNYAYLYSIGLMLFALCLACANMKKLYVQMEKSVHAETYQKMAYSDALTGLENRMALEKRQTQMPDRVTYVLFDLNDLKGINDHYGHSAGDTAIIAAAESIREAFQGLGRCYRIGGDEFLAVLEDASDQELLDAEQTMYQYLEQKSRGLPYEVTVAMGAARSTGPEETEDSLFSRADERMYQRKEQMKKERSQL